MFAMKKTLLLAATALTAMTACNSQSDEHSRREKPAQEPKTQQAASTKDNDNTDISKISEALGHFIGRNLKAPGIKFDLESIVKGMREGAAGKPAPMNDEEYEKAMAQLQEKAFSTLADTNLEAADAFMKENANTTGVTEIVPGKLQYTILQEGSGPEVPEHGTPLINYTGKYIDGTTFGSSESAGGPITVPIDQTIPGFTKGIAGMKEGEKRRLFIHPELGYGRSGQLAPNSLLIFDIEVVKAASPEKDDSNAASFNSDEDRNLDDELESDQDLDAADHKPAQS